jgi:hypothetical protein
VIAPAQSLAIYAGAAVKDQLRVRARARAAGRDVALKVYEGLRKALKRQEHAATRDA